MDVRVTSDPRAFEQTAFPFLQQDPVLHNLVMTVVHERVTGRAFGGMIGNMTGAWLCAGLALLVTSGCHAWRERPVTAPDASAVTGTVRLTTNHGARRLTLERVTLGSDSVVGRLVDAAHRSGDRWVPDSTLAKGKRAAVAVADIGSLEEQTDSATRTVLLIGFLAALAFAVAFYAVGGPKSG